MFITYLSYVYTVNIILINHKETQNTMKILGINIQKGGAGKTAFSVNFADYLSNFGSTLIVDADPSGNTTRFFTSLFNSDLELDILPENELASVFRNQPVSPIEIKPNLDLLAGSNELYDVIQELTSKNKGLTTFKNWVRRAKLKDVYDYIIIDTHNDKGVITKAMLLSCNMVLAIIEPSQLAIDGYTKLKAVADDLREDIDLVDDNDNPYMTDNIFYILNKISSTETASKEMMSYINNPKQYADNRNSNSLFALQTLPPVEEYLSYFKKNTIFEKAISSNRTIIDMSDTSEYRRKRYLPFFENIKKTMDNVKDVLDNIS